MKFLPIALLFISNIFMSFAWYGHLKNTHSALWFAIVSSWGIAFFEYCFSIPANRILNFLLWHNLRLFKRLLLL